MFQRSQAIVCISVTQNSRSFQRESSMSIYLKFNFFFFKISWLNIFFLNILTNPLTSLTALLKPHPLFEAYLTNVFATVPSTLLVSTNPCSLIPFSLLYFFSFSLYHCKTRLSRKVWLLLNVEPFSIITMVLELLIRRLFSRLGLRYL